MPESLAFIGGGKMAEALLKGVLSSGLMTVDHVVVADKSPERTSYLSATYGVRSTHDNHEAATAAGAVLMAVKPQDIDQALGSIRTAAAGKLVISIAAGISSSRIRSILGDNPVVRVMPNTPALVGKGMSALAFTEDVSSEQREFANRLFDAVGLTSEVDEALIDQVTAVSGSGPAYFFLFTAALAKAGEKLGLPKELSYRLAVQTAVGSAVMLAETELDAGQLVEMVASPGGTTMAALDVFDQRNIDDIMGDAVLAAWRRAKELGAGSS